MSCFTTGFTWRFITLGLVFALFGLFSSYVIKFIPLFCLICLCVSMVIYLCVCFHVFIPQVFWSSAQPREKCKEQWHAPARPGGCLCNYVTEWVNMAVCICFWVSFNFLQICSLGVNGKELWREVLHHHRKLGPQHASVSGCEWGNTQR